MAEPLTEDDIKFYLSIEPDEEAVRKAIEQINRDIEREKVEKVRLQIEEHRAGPQPPPLSREQVMLSKVQEQIRLDEERAQMKQLKEQLLGPPPEVKEETREERIGRTAREGIAADKERKEVEAERNRLLLEEAGQLGKVNEVLKQVVKGTEWYIKALSATRDVLSGVQGSLGGIGVGLNLASRAMEMLADGAKKVPVIGETLGQVFNQLGKLPQILGEILQVGVSMAQKANPGAFRQLTIALEDAMATIGQAFVPVIEEMVPIIREIGTAIAQALPSDQEMRSMFRELFESIRDMVKELAPLAGPLLKSVVEGVKLLVNVVSVLAKVLGPVLRPVIAVVNAVLSVLNTFVKAISAMVDAVKAVIRKIPVVGKWLVGDDDQKEKPREAISAARPAWMGSIQEYQNRLQLQTASGPSSMGPESVPRNVGNLAQMVGNIEKWFTKMSPAAWEEIMKKAGANPSQAREIVDRAEMVSARR